MIVQHPFLSSFQKIWHLITQIALIIFLVISPLLVVPDFREDVALLQPNYLHWARFLVLALLLLFLFPAYAFARRADARWWWLLALILLIAGVVLQSYYLNFLDRHSTLDTYSGKRVAIGDSFLPSARTAIDSAKRRNPNLELTPDRILSGFPNRDPELVWTRETLHISFQGIFELYSLVVITYSFFILCIIQSFFCLLQKR